MSADREDNVPRLPRGKGFRITSAQLLKIALTAALLVMLIVVQRPCADGVSEFVTSFGESGSAAGSAMPKPGKVEAPGSAHYEPLRPDMTEDEIKAAIERARARATQGSAGSGSAAAGSGSAAAGSGSKAAGSGSGSGARDSNAAGSSAGGSATNASTPSGL